MKGWGFMRNFKKMLIVYLTLCLFFAVGCSAKEKVTPDMTATSMFDFFIKGDKEAIAKINVPNEEIDASAKIQKDTTISLVKNNLKSSGIEVKEEKLEELYNVRAEALKKLTCTSEIISQAEDSAEVRIKSTYIDEVAIDNKAADDALETVKQMGLTDQKEAINKVGDEYVKNLINGYQSASPSQDTKEKIFKFTKKDKIWLPQSMVEFGNGIGLLAAGQ